MTIEIKGKEYPITFGIGFIRELDKKYLAKEATGQILGIGIESTVPHLLIFNTVILSEILYAGTCTLKSRPAQKDIDTFIENHEDIDGLFEEVIDELKKQNATKKKVALILGDMDEEQKKESEESKGA